MREEEIGSHCWLLLTCCITLDNVPAMLECICCKRSHSLLVCGTQPLQGEQNAMKYTWQPCCWRLLLSPPSALSFPVAAVSVQSMTQPCWCHRPVVHVMSLVEVLHFVAGKHSVSKSLADVQPAQFSNDETIRWCLILLENVSVPPWYT